MSSLDPARGPLHRARLAVGVALVALASASTVRAAGQQCLEQVQTQMTRQFSAVPHWQPEALSSRLASGASDIVVLDVREAEEFAVSRLPGAERVAPRATADAVVEAAGGSVAGKDVVLYCSVGYRSSKLASALRAELSARGARSVANLQGGIFAWHNTGRPTVDAAGATVFVHPYDRRWTSYVDFNNLTRMRATGR